MDVGNIKYFFYRWEGWWKVKGCLAFCSNLIQVWHTVFKITVGSDDSKGSPVLRQYNFWQNFSWEVGNNVQPNCCKILVGERSCASAWDAVLLRAVRCGRAAAAGGEGSVLQRQTELFITVWHRMLPWLQCSQLLLQRCHRFPGKYRSCTASSPFPVSVHVLERD